MPFLVQRKPFLVSKMQLSVSMDPASPGLPSRVPSLPAAHSFRAAMNGMLDSLERPLPSPDLLSLPSLHALLPSLSFPIFLFFLKLSLWKRQDHFPGLTDSHLFHSLDVPPRPPPSHPGTGGAALSAGSFGIFFGFYGVLLHNPVSTGVSKSGATSLAAFPSSRGGSALPGSDLGPGLMLSGSKPCTWKI